MSIAEDVLQLKCIVKNIQIRLCCRVESGVKELLALVTSENELILLYTYGELQPVIKRIPWLSDSDKIIEAVCFDPSATWLLLTVLDGSVCIIPALSLVDKKQKIDCKWSLNDVTTFPKHAQTPDSKPKAIVWWQTLDSNQNALVGYESGSIASISLTDGRCLGCCQVPDVIAKLSLCQDNSLDTVSLLINGESGQQWRLTLEQNNLGCLWPELQTAPSEDLSHSRLYTLKQIGVDTLASLKQKLVDKSSKKDSQSDTNSECSNPESVHSVPELLPCLCDTVFSPQHARNRYLFTAFYKPTSLLTVHAVDVDSAPLFIHKLPRNVEFLLLTDRLIFTVGNDRIDVVSAQLSECRVDGDSGFNAESLLAQFSMHNEQILNIFKLNDLTYGRGRRNREDSRKEKYFELPQKVEDLNVKKPKIDTCVIVTDKAVYKIIVSCSPVDKFIHFITELNDFERAEKLALVFGLNQQQLLECCGDLMVAHKSFHSGIILYKQARVHLLKRVLKLAISADCRTLLKFIHLCLSTSRVDMSMPTKIHIGNLAVMAYTELVLRYGGGVRMTNVNDFMNFLRTEEFYDEILAVNVACQAGQWNVVTVLAKCRGIQTEVVAAFSQILQNASSRNAQQQPITNRDFLLALSEPCLTQSLLILPQCSATIFTFVRDNVAAFQTDLLRRFLVQLDPSQAGIAALVNRLVSVNGGRYSSSLETTLDSLDLDDPYRMTVIVKDLIETFIYVLVSFLEKTGNNGYDIDLLDLVHGKQTETPPVKAMEKLPNFTVLSCGYEHAAVIRNSHVYTMGVATSGCLGFGPMLTQSSPPKPVQTLVDLDVKVLSVSCGRKHTLALTDHGVYSWGSNVHGQLGTSALLRQTPYPQPIPALADKHVVQVCAGQYHSAALTASGVVYTWGWGVHGQLGHGACDSEYEPRQVRHISERIVQVAAGHAHTLVLSESGAVFGFGSNVFGQLECGAGGEEANKMARPVRVVIGGGDKQLVVEKISTAYFHNIAACRNGDVYTWGASPQEMRVLQNKCAAAQKQATSNSGGDVTTPAPSIDSWKSSVKIYAGSRVPRQVTVGYRHSAVLDDGRILWGKSKDDELTEPKMRDKDKLFGFGHNRFEHVSCGLDYTMALDHSGKLLAWGSPTMAQTILGRPLDEQDGRRTTPDGKIVIFKNTRRLVKFPHNPGESNCDYYPIEIPGLPTMAITYNPINHKTLLSKNPTRQIIEIDGSDMKKSDHKSPLNFVQNIPKITRCTSHTLHHVLEMYRGFYDTENVLSRCLEVKNYQAASKIAMLNGHYSDSLGFQLSAFQNYMNCHALDLDSIFVNKELYESVKEKDQDFVELVVRNIQDDYNSTRQLILSTSSSLDSMRNWNDAENEGGCESPCEMYHCEMNDIKQSMSHYVKSLKNHDSPPISSVSKRVDNTQNEAQKLIELEIRDEVTRDIIENVSTTIEFYIEKIYTSENHILMQNVLMKCIEFWLNNRLPVPILENVLLKNMDKYFYPLSILLFCKNFREKDDDITEKNNLSADGFLKEFSTKFCLHLCSMVLENVNRA